MPDIICGRCGTTLALPYRRNNDVPPLLRTCPTCAKEFIMQDVEPMARGKPGVIQILQNQLSAEADSKPAVLRKGPTIPQEQWPKMSERTIVRLRETNPKIRNSSTGEPAGIWQPQPIQTFG